MSEDTKAKPHSSGLDTKNILPTESVYTVIVAPQGAENAASNEMIRMHAIASSADQARSDVRKAIEKRWGRAFSLRCDFVHTMNTSRVMLTIMDSTANDTESDMLYTLFENNGWDTRQDEWQQDQAGTLSYRCNGSKADELKLN